MKQRQKLDANEDDFEDNAGIPTTTTTTGRRQRQWK